MPPLQTKSVKKFGGLQQYKTISAVSMDEALQCVNVFTAPGGYLQKMRTPTPLTGPIMQSGNASIVSFQQGNGTRQLLVMLGTQIWVYSTDALVPMLIDDNPLNAALWSCVESNNILFMANGKRMLKWTGVALQNWGIETPPSPPTIAINFGLSGATTFSRTTGVTSLTGTIEPAQGNFLAFAPSIGDVITVIGAADPSFNGTFPITATSPVQWNNPGANGTTTGGSISLPYQRFTATIASALRLSGVSTVFLSTAFYATWVPGDTIIVDSVPDATFNGTWQVTSSNRFTGAVTFNQPDLPDSSVGGAGNISPGLQNTAGMSWRYAYGNSVTGHVGNASDACVTQPGLSSGAHEFYGVNAVAPPSGDPQIDTIYWFRTLDGGSDYFLEQTTPISQLYIIDSRADSALNTQTRCQLINNVPPLGTYLTKWQDRIYISGIIGAPQDIAYSGYERILLGRPEESFPPNNRLRLSIGADDVRATGAIQAGLVAWSHSSEMFMLRGSMEDIVTDNPVPPSSYLEQLPWNQGANSHYSVQPTPRGLLWWASDNTVQLWNGTYLPEYMGPQQASVGVYPTLNRVTTSQKQFVKSCWLNVGDRELYILNVPLDGAAQPNLLLFFDMTPGDDNAGVFESTIQADDITTWEDSTGQIHLLILQNGSLYDFPYQSTIQNGMVIDVN